MNGQRRGSLSAVGIGIRAPGQATLEACARIKHAEKVFSLVSDPVAEYWLRTLNPNTESLAHFYAVGKERRETYREMVERIVGAVRSQVRVCAVSYGHPGVTAYPLHESVRRAREEGFEAEMLAGISAVDCLFADLGIDPTVNGCRSYEATYFLLRRLEPDPRSNLVLWQVGVIAESGYHQQHEAWNRRGLAVLAETLLESYPRDHEVVVYEAARHPACDPMIARIALADLPSAPVTAMSTLFVPATSIRPLDDAMAKRLGLIRRASDV